MIYQRIKELCEVNETSVNALEDKLNISRGSLCKIDKHKPSSEKLRKIAKELKTTSDYLLTGVEPNSEFTPEQAKLDLLISQDTELKEALKLYSTLSDEKKKHIIETIRMISEAK